MLRAAQRAVGLLGATDDLVWQGRALGHRAKAYLALGAVARADEDYVRSEELFARAGQRLEYASAVHDRGTTAFARGDLPAALALLDDAQQVVDELDVFEPELDVTRVQVLLAAQLHRDALRVADDAVARSIRLHGSAARRAELLFAAALAASASGDSPDRGVPERRGAAHVPPPAARLVGRPGRAGAAGEPVRHRRHVGRPAAGGHPARRSPGVGGRHERPEARLLCGRLALARGRRAVGILHLRAAAARRPRDVRARSTGWLARAVLADVEGRPGDMLAACARGLDLIDAHLGTLGATELRAQATAQGDDLARLAMDHAARTGDAGRLLAWSERWRATALAVPPVRRDVDPELTRDLAALRVLAARLEDELPAAAAPAVRRDRRRLEEAVRRRALHRPGAGSGRTTPVRVAELRDLLGGADLVELTEVDGQLFAVVLSGHRPAHDAPRRRGRSAERALDHALFALRRAGTPPGRDAARPRPDRGPGSTDLARPPGRHADGVLRGRRPHRRPPRRSLALLPGLRGRAVTVALSAA